MKTKYDKKQNILIVALAAIAVLSSGTLALSMVKKSENKQNEKIQQLTDKQIYVENMLKQNKANYLYVSYESNEGVIFDYYTREGDEKQINYLEFDLNIIDINSYSLFYVETVLDCTAIGDIYTSNNIANNYWHKLSGYDGDTGSFGTCNFTTKQENNVLRFEISHSELDGADYTEMTCFYNIVGIK